MRTLVASTALSLLFAVRAASAQEPPGEMEKQPSVAPAAPGAEAESAGGEKGGHEEFGEAGVIAVEAATGLEVAQTSTKAAQGENPESRLAVRVEPSFHYFVAENISVGALLAFELQKQGDEKEQGIALGPLVGYNLPLGEHLSLWPKVGAAYVLLSRKEPSATGTGTESMSGNKIVAMAEVPVLVHVASHFHFGIGPFIRMDVSSKIEGKDADKDTTVGLLGAIGGWL